MSLEATLAAFSDSFWSRVDQSAGPDSCWPWTGSKDPCGYGIGWLGRRLIRAHRVALVLSCGPIAEGQCALHGCDNRLCCNPKHLRAGTHADNVRDRQERDRTARGEQNGRAKITEAQAREVRRLTAGLSRREVAELLGLPFCTVRSIARGTTWKHVRGLRLPEREANKFLLKQWPEVGALPL